MIVALLVAILVLLLVGTLRDVRNHEALKTWAVLVKLRPEQARAIVLKAHGTKKGNAALVAAAAPTQGAKVVDVDVLLVRGKRYTAGEVAALEEQLAELRGWTR